MVQIIQELFKSLRELSDEEFEKLHACACDVRDLPEDEYKLFEEILKVLFKETV